MLQGKVYQKRSLVLRSWYFVAVIAGILLIVSIPGYFERFVWPPLSQHFPTGIVLLSIVSGSVSFISAVISLGLAALLFFRRPGDHMATFVSYYLLGYGMIMTGPLESLEVLLFGKTGALSLYAQLILFTMPTLALFLIFPTGRFVPPQARWILFLSLLAFLPVPWMSYQEFYSVTTLRGVILDLYLILLSLCAFASQLYRYFKKSSPPERQQTKWVVYGFGLWILFMLISALLYFILVDSADRSVLQAWQNAFGIFWQIGVAMIPVSLTIAIARSHLWDIDVIIRKTLIYTVLTATLGLVYFGSILLLQEIFTAIGLARSPVVIVVSTLAIFALAAPFRRRIQNFIDQRFYRKRYDAERTLASFGAELRDKVDLDQLSASMLDVVQETIQPESVALWLLLPKENR